MASIKPFSAIRPIEEKVSNVAALPYDVVNTEEARVIVKNEPDSFLKIDRAEVQFENEINIYSKEVYEKARDTLNDMIDEGIYIQEDKDVYYIYQLTMNGRKQTGIVACSSVDDYINNVIKKHEKTREEKEQDRINHVDYCNAHTGPIFLAYRGNEIINSIVSNVINNTEAKYDFVAEDGIGHAVWVIDEEQAIKTIENAFATINEIYIADGHHRAASAVKVGLKRREKNTNYTGKEGYNYFLSVLFPHSELKILSYNRVVKDLNGLSSDEFINAIKNNFDVEEKGNIKYQPESKATFGMFLEDKWYKLTFKGKINVDDPVEKLDVSILQNNLLNPILGIKDPRTDNRIDFVGGIRGLEELEKRIHTDMKVAFSMYPTSIEELFEVSDVDKLMPPKSTWFEPKLRSGIFVHCLDDSSKI